MIEVVKEYWAVIAGTVVGIFWLGRLEYRMGSQEKDPKVTIENCSKQMGACKLFNTAEFAHGTREFDEFRAGLKALTGQQLDAERASEARHRELLKILLEKT